MKISLKKILPPVIICLVPSLSFAINSNNPSARLSIWGAGATRVFGEGDGMLAHWTNDKQLFFANGTAKYGNNDAWLGSLGLGNRTIVNGRTIVGGYVFADYNRTPYNNSFTVVNPGLELMTLRWDAHLNGYIPASKKNRVINLYTASQLGLSERRFFSGHAEYSALFNSIETVGPGADFEIGRTVYSLNQTRFFVGGYYFSPQNNNAIRGFGFSDSIKGIGAGLEAPLRYQNMKVGVRDTYDNLNHNTIAVTLRITFGGFDNNKQTIQQRMLDVIPRHFGSLRSGDGIPSKKFVVQSNRSLLVQNNLWFFNGDGSPSTVSGIQNCTFENPCIGLSQAQIDAINILSPNANFYLNSGTYNNPVTGTGYAFYNGQSIYGRTNNFSVAAFGNNRPVINSSLLLEGNNTLSNLIINGNVPVELDSGMMATQIFQPAVITDWDSVGAVNILGSDLQSSSTTNNVAGVAFQSRAGGATMNIVNSTITTNASGTLIAVGAANLQNNVLNINNSILVSNSTDPSNTSALGFGVVNNQGGIVNINNSAISTTVTNSPGLAVGVLNNSSDGTGLGTVNISRTTINTIGENTDVTAAILNQANNLANISGTVNVTESSLFARSNNGNNTAAAATTGTGTLNIFNSNLISTGNAGSVFGLAGYDASSSFTYAGNTIAVNILNAATGMPVLVNGSVNNLGSNLCFNNGVQVPC